MVRTDKNAYNEYMKKYMQNKRLKKYPDQDFILQFHKIQRMRRDNVFNDFTWWLNNSTKVHKELLSCYTAYDENNHLKQGLTPAHHL